MAVKYWCMFQRVLMLLTCFVVCESIQSVYGHAVRGLLLLDESERLAKKCFGNKVISSQSVNDGGEDRQETHNRVEDVPADDGRSLGPLL